MDNSPFLSTRTIQGMTKRRPGRPLSEYVAAWESEGSIKGAARLLRCSAQTVREALFVAGVDLSAEVPKRAGPKKLPLLRCHCCSQVRTTPTCPVTGEVIAAAFLGEA